MILGKFEYHKINSIGAFFTAKGDFKTMRRVKPH